LSHFYLSKRRFRALSFPDLVIFKSGKEKRDFGLDEHDPLTVRCQDFRRVPRRSKRAGAHAPEPVQLLTRIWRSRMTTFLTLAGRGCSVRGAMSATYPVFVTRALDGFFGLLIANLVLPLLLRI